jgi:hypothetical protein
MKLEKFLNADICHIAICICCFSGRLWGSTKCCQRHSDQCSTVIINTIQHSSHIHMCALHVVQSRCVRTDIDLSIKWQLVVSGRSLSR